MRFLLPIALLGFIFSNTVQAKITVEELALSEMIAPSVQAQLSEIVFEDAGKKISEREATLIVLEVLKTFKNQVSTLVKEDKNIVELEGFGYFYLKKIRAHQRKMRNGEVINLPKKEFIGFKAH